MGKFTGTPGPWTATPYLGLGDFTIRGPSGEEVAVVNANNGLDEPDWYPSEANAALIAASPELLEVADTAPILSKYHGHGGFDVERFIADYEAWSAKRRAAISRATQTEGKW